ncbi:SDR family NAD(P)-dependent oxidoreductase [Oxalobacteraceae bacterium]|nr:SDR family NAD(P)-dependent oxidoreductase [Oxalobacteraceae bacterium]
MIVGGTSGIGLALARHYLDGGASVAVCGRDPERVPAALPQRYPRLQTLGLDIAERPALERAMHAFCEAGPLDLLVVAAGFYFNTRHQQLDAATTLRMLRTNVSGLSHAFELGAARMLAQGSGQLVAISSVAGLLHDFPGASLYSATKRSVLSLCDSYRKGLAPFGIGVTAIVPGYIDTARLRELNDGDASAKPFLLSEAQAVEQIAEAIARREARRVFPRRMAWLIALLNLLPRIVLSWRP